MQIQAMMGGMDMNAMREMRAAMFAKADGDKSGGLSLQEFTKTAASGPMARMGQMSDAPDTKDMFASLDADGDGNLTSAELDSMKPPQQLLGNDAMAALLSLQGLDQSSGGAASGASGTSQALSDLLSQALDAFADKSKKDEDRTSRFDLAA